MFKNMLAPVQAWLLAQGKCVGCGKVLAGKEAKGLVRVDCECGRIYICMTQPHVSFVEHLFMKSNNRTVTHFGAFLLSVLVALGVAFLWWNDAMGPVDPRDDSFVSFTVNKGDGVRVIAANLASEKLIRSPTAFFLLVKLQRMEYTLQAGEFRLQRSMNSRMLAQELTRGFIDIWVTTLEGWRVEEIANRLAKDMDLPEAEFLKVAKEGYMFPDTYLVPPDATSGALAKIFTDTFNTKVTTKIRDDAKKHNLSFAEIITLASIVEREGRTNVDRPVIAGVLLKRLEADWPLQVDATLQYALGYQASEKTWWKKYLTVEDKSVKSPYNTYVHTGLPPGPICNPGLESIQAVVYPAESEYWYYIHDDTGAVHFAKTLEEHEANVAKYLL